MAVRILNLICKIDRYYETLSNIRNEMSPQIQFVSV